MYISFCIASTLDFRFNLQKRIIIKGSLNPSQESDGLCDFFAVDQRLNSCAITQPRCINAEPDTESDNTKSDAKPNAKPDTFFFFDNLGTGGSDGGLNLLSDQL